MIPKKAVARMLKYEIKPKDKPPVVRLKTLAILSRLSTTGVFLLTKKGGAV